MSDKNKNELRKTGFHERDREVAILKDKLRVLVLYPGTTKALKYDRQVREDEGFISGTGMIGR